jgi:hypothetical protein
MTIQQLAQERDALEARVLSPDYTATERDVAVAADLIERYIDELQRLEETAAITEYLRGEAVSDKVLSYWSYHE